MNRILVLLTCGLLAANIVACGDESEGGGSASGDTNNAPANNAPANNAPANNAPANNAPANNDPNNTPNNTPNNAPNNTPSSECGDGVCNGEEDNASCAADCPAGAPADYNYDVAASRIDSITLITEADSGVDQNGDGTPDNALGALLNDLGALLMGTDLNATLAEAIATGDLSIGATWPDGIADGEVSIDLFLLEDTDDNPETTDAYTADPESFRPGTSIPRISFQGAQVSGGALEAGPSQFALTIPLGDIALSVIVDNALITGNVSEDAAGVVLDGDNAGGAALSGAVSLDSIVAALNAYLQSDSCSCLGLNGPLIDLSAGVGPQACSTDFDTATCEADGQDICSTIAGACGLAVPVIAGQTDIDLDGDSEPDAISLFVNLTMAGTSISAP